VHGAPGTYSSTSRLALAVSTFIDLSLPFIHGFQTPVRYPAGHCEEHDRRLAFLQRIRLPPTICVVGDGGGNHSSRPRLPVDSTDRPIWPLPTGFAPRYLATANGTMASSSSPPPPSY